MFDDLFKFYFAPDADQTQGGEAEADEQNAYDAGKDTDDDFDRSTLEENTEDRLDAVFSGLYDDYNNGEDLDDDADENEEEDESDGQEDESDDDAAADEDESGEADDDDDEEYEEDDSDDSDEEDEAGEAAASDGAPTLPDAYRRSLYAYGWKDEEIDQNLESLGDSFIKTAERIHGNRNAELQQWAQAGRDARTQQEGQATGQPDSGQQTNQPSQQSQQGQLPQKLQPVDADKLKQEYGEDELIDAIVGPVNATIESVNSILPQLQQGQQAAEQAQVQQVQREVEKFFGDESMTLYTELYGSEKDGLSDEQVGHRNKVLDTAYDLMVGAQSLRNQALPLEEALEHAHQIVAKDFNTTAARNSVKREAKQRNRGISQKPSRRRGGKDKPVNGRPQNRSELESRTSQRLKKAFG